MVDKNYLSNIPVPTSNILHDSTEHNLSNLSYNTYSQYEVNNLIFNSNLENSNIIK